MPATHLGRRTIRRFVPNDNLNRPNPNIRMWHLGDAPKGTVKRRLQDAYTAALTAVDLAEIRRTEATKSGRFTPEGAKQDVRSFVMKDLVPVFKRGRVTLEMAKREAETIKSKIKLAAPDKSDFVGALHRAELRDFLRSKPQKERDEYIGRNIDRLDPQLALAMIELGADVVGISEVYRNRIVDHALQAQHGDAMRDVKDLEEAITIAESAIETGRTEIQFEAGYFSRVEFEHDASPHEKNAGVAWLRKSGDQTIVVDLELNVGRAPTAEELETGVFFENYSDYCRANGLAEVAAA